LPECDEHDNPHKKNKMDLPDVENENLNHLVKKGVDAISYENSSLKELKIFYTQQRIEEFELDGVMHVFRGDPDFRKHAWNCWERATVLREKNALQNIS
jgi:hypothetical protein